MDVQVEQEVVGTRTVVRVAGEIDVASADRLRERLARAVAEGGTDLVVDLTAVTFMDSTGLGLLVGTLKRVRTAGGRMALVIDSDQLMKIFTITGLHQVFAIHPTLDAALAD